MGLFLHNNPLWTLDVESTVRPCREWAESWGALKPTVLPAWAHLPPHTPGGGEAAGHGAPCSGAG